MSKHSVTRRLTTVDLAKMKSAGEKIAMLTCYDASFAQSCDAAGIDSILVGDSLGMITLGYQGTIPVTMEDCISHCKAVRRGAPNTFVMGDMPFGSYQVSDADAVANAVRFLKEADMDAIKLEGGVRVKSHPGHSGRGNPRVRPHRPHAAEFGPPGRLQGAGAGHRVRAVCD